MPERSSAVMVLAKSGAAGSCSIAAISAAWSAKACSKAGRKCSGAISANGGVSNGVCHAFSSGFAWACEAAAISVVSDIKISRFRSRMNCRNLYHAMGLFWAFYA